MPKLLIYTIYEGTKEYLYIFTKQIKIEHDFEHFSRDVHQKVLFMIQGKH